MEMTNLDYCINFPFMMLALRSTGNWVWR